MLSDNMTVKINKIFLGKRYLENQTVHESDYKELIEGDSKVKSISLESKDFIYEILFEADSMTANIEVIVQTDKQTVKTIVNWMEFKDEKQIEQGLEYYIRGVIPEFKPVEKGDSIMTEQVEESKEDQKSPEVEERIFFTGQRVAKLKIIGYLKHYLTYGLTKPYKKEI